MTERLSAKAEALPTLTFSSEDEVVEGDRVLVDAGDGIDRPYLGKCK